MVCQYISWLPQGAWLPRLAQQSLNLSARVRHGPARERWQWLKAGLHLREDRAQRCGMKKKTFDSKELSGLVQSANHEFKKLQTDFKALWLTGKGSKAFQPQI